MRNEEAIKWLNVERQLIVEIPQDNSKELKEAYDMAIKALEQQPCEDCISRQDAIEYLCTNMNWYDEDGETADDEEKLNAITDLVNGVPSVTPKAKWIPVSERLPEVVHEFKFIGYEGKESDQVLIYGNVKDSTEIYYGTGRYNKGYDHEEGEEFEEWSDCEGEGYILDVIAWMPIQPYKEVQSDG